MASLTSHKAMALCALLMFVSLKNAECQSINPDETIFLVVVDVQGRSWVFTGEFYGWQLVNNLVGYVKEPQIQDELELGTSQRSELNGIQRELEVKEVKFRDALVKLRQGTSETTEAEIMDELEEWRIETGKAIESILLPHQRRRLNELIYRFVIRQVGFVQVVTSNEDAGLSIEAKRQLREESSKVGVSLGEKVKSLRSDAIERLCSVLDEAQLKKLESIVGDASKLSNASIELLIWQLEFDEDSNWDCSPDGYSLSADVSFRLSPVGTLQYRGLQTQEWTVQNNLTELMAREDIQQSLAMTDGQIEIVNGIVDRAREQNMEIVDYKSYAPRSKIDPEAMNNRKLEVWKEANEEIYKVLHPAQVQAMSILNQRAEFLRFGPVASLARGRLGNELKVTKKQRAELFQKAKKIRDELVEESRNCEQKAMDQLLEVLDGPTRETLKSRIGKRLEHVPPNIGMLIWQLQNPTGYKADAWTLLE